MKTKFTGSRRTFIKSAAILAGFAALFGRGRPVAATPTQPLEQKTESGQGYRLTEHVKKYYETARL
jgi:hypothetical protein